MSDKAKRLRQDSRPEADSCSLGWGLSSPLQRRHISHSLCQAQGPHARQSHQFDHAGTHDDVLEKPHRAVCISRYVCFQMWKGQLFLLTEDVDIKYDFLDDILGRVTFSALKNVCGT